MFRRKPKPTDKLRTMDREAFRLYLVDLRNHFGDYHARKENVAWLATVLYVGSAGGLLSVMVTNSTFKLWLSAGRLLWLLPFFLILFLAFLTHKFLDAQFSARFVAADLIEACGDLLAQLLRPNAVLR